MIFLFQILFVTIFLTLIRHSNDDKEEFYLNGNVRHRVQPSPVINRSIRLRDEDLMIERENRTRQRQQRSFLIDSIVKLCSAVLIIIVVANHNDRNAFLHIKHLQRYFLNQRYSSIDYSKVRSTINHRLFVVQFFFVDRHR